jgi:hypothetical protein
VRPRSLRKGRVLRMKMAMATVAAMILPSLLRIKPVRNPPRRPRVRGYRARVSSC